MPFGGAVLLNMLNVPKPASAAHSKLLFNDNKVIYQLPSVQVAQL